MEKFIRIFFNDFVRSFNHQGFDGQHDIVQRILDHGSDELVIEKMFAGKQVDQREFDIVVVLDEQLSHGFDYLVFHCVVDQVINEPSV